MQVRDRGVHGGALALFTKPSVLIVDGSDDSREVLRTALERRGMEIFEASRAERGLELARRHHPRVIVLDLEVETDECDQICGQFAEQSDGKTTSLVVLANAQIPVTGDADRDREFVAKPYHYGPLVRKILELLD